MDTSETYIKQSDKARKYLPKHIWRDGDFVAIPQPKGYHVVIYHDAYFEEYMCGFDSDKSVIPLLRQDQLQAMITDRPMSGLLLDFRDSALAFLWGDGLDSMEQLWVAFVMKEKYNKVWNGEGWIEDIASASTGLDNSTSRRG